MKNGLVRNWMTHKVVTVAPETHLSDARRIMNGEKIRSLPVVKNDRLVGIVTRRGLLRADISALQETNWNIQVDLNSEPVSSVMTASPITTSPETALPKAARVMLENKITALPVMNGSTRPVGILTTSDLFRAIIEEVPRVETENTGSGIHVAQCSLHYLGNFHSGSPPPDGRRAHPLAAGGGRGQAGGHRHPHRPDERRPLPL
jgi:CBS domain-containing protein